MEKYTDSCKSTEAAIESLRTEMEGRYENINQYMKRFVTNNDMKVNFEAYSDILFVKFRQVEDTKTAVRDIIAF